MVKINNFNSIPASFVEIAPQSPDNGLYTRGTLDVFYVGETADHRLFTKEFSDNLLKSIAYTPVVSHYDDERDEFEGHAAQQEIYGLVDPMVAPTYVEHDGATWARCETILYTERPDKVGEIASKIIGHAQSLELQPDTLKYKINRDAQGNFKNLEFLDGKFIGVSVLGKDQEPAFTGSGFFEKLPLEAFARGKEMTLTIQEFAKLSWGEKANYIANALYAKYGDNFWCIRDVYDNAVVYSVYDEESNSIRLYRCKYKLDGENATLTSEPEEVHPSYEKLEAIDPAEVATAVSKKQADEYDEDVNNIEPEAEPEQEPEQSEPKQDPEPNTDPVENLEPTDPEPAQDPNPEPAQDPDPEPAQDPEPEQQPEPEQNPEPEPVTDAGNATLDAGAKGSENEEEKPTATSTLSDSERIELEAYRKAKKIELINSYSADLSEEEVKELVEKVDEYSFDALKNELDARFVANVRKQRAEAPATPAAASFKWYPSTPKSGNNELAAYISDLLHK